MERKKAPAMGWPALLLLCCGLAGIPVRAAHAGPPYGPCWGAIASINWG
jgi:hypothetical protein